MRRSAWRSSRSSAAPLLLRGERGMRPELFARLLAAPARPSSPARSCSPSRLPSCSPRRPAECCSSPTSRGSARASSASGVPAAARREAQGAHRVVFAARRAGLAEKHDFDPTWRAARGAHAQAAGGARVRRGRARPRLAHAGAAGRGARLSAAAPLDRRAQRAAPPRRGPATWPSSRAW